MMYNLNEINATDRQMTSPYITYGSGWELRINDIELKASPTTGSPKAILYVETKPVTDKDFKPVDNAKGRVGKLAIGVYMKTDEQKTEFLKKLKMIAIALGLEDEINATKGNTFEDVVSNIKSVICGGDKFARYTIFAEQYPRPDDKLGIKLFLPRYNFVESIDIDPLDSRLVKFDENNTQQFKPFKPTENSIMDGPDSMFNDLPF